MFTFIIGLNNIMLNNHSIAILHMLMTKVYKIEVCLLFAIRIVYCVYYYYFISLLILSIKITITHACMSDCIKSCRIVYCINPLIKSFIAWNKMSINWYIRPI